jgi:NAD(P)H-dependent FMN reductase
MTVLVELRSSLAMPLQILVIYGSVRSGRQGIKAARFITDTCRKRGHDVTLIDPIEHPLPLLDKMYKEYEPGQAPEVLERLAIRIKAADAFVIVTGEYNHSIPPALSNLLDHFLEEYFWRPSAIVSYSAGSFGGVRAAMQMRAMLGELGMPSIPSILPAPKVQDAFDDDGNPRDDGYHRRAERFLKELEWYAGALKVARADGVPY